MRYIDGEWVWKAVFGNRRPRRVLVVSIIGFLLLVSIAFLAGVRIGLHEFGWWIVLIMPIAVVAGVVGAGLLPTISSLWLIGIWVYIFPPLVGYLTGEWTGMGRYAYPRMRGFLHTSARAEVFGGIEMSVNFGLLMAIIIGTLGYVSGAIIRWLATQVGRLDY